MIIVTMHGTNADEFFKDGCFQINTTCLETPWKKRCGGFKYIVLPLLS